MHVSFDLDGVLLDSESDLDWLDRALSATLRELDLPDTDENRDRLSPWRVTSFETSAAELGVDPERLWAVRNRHYTREKVAAIETGEIGPFPDVETAVERVAADHECSIVSNSPQAVVETFVSVHLDPDAFVALVGRGDALEDLDRLKPDPFLYERLRAAAGLAEDDRVVYVGDTADDAAFARAVDAEFVGVRRPEDDDLADLRTLPDVLSADDPRHE